MEQFLGQAEQRQRFSPEEYAKCIAGMQVAMLTGQIETKAYAGVRCHIPTKDAANRTVCRVGCGMARPPSLPQMQLAKTRLEEGFAFVGLTEEYPLSICLFSRMFGTPCLKELFNNSRPTSERGSSYRPSRRSNTTIALNLTTAAERDDEVFADPYDVALHAWVRQRFARDLAHYGLSRAVCARDVCTDAAGRFQPR